MPTLKVGPDNTIQYVTSDGNVLSEVEYDSNTGHLRFVDDAGSPAPAEFGETVHDSVSTKRAGITDPDTGKSGTITFDGDTNSLFVEKEV